MNNVFLFTLILMPTVINAGGSRNNDKVVGMKANVWAKLAELRFRNNSLATRVENLERRVDTLKKNKNKVE